MWTAGASVGWLDGQPYFCLDDHAPPSRYARKYCSLLKRRAPCIGPSTQYNGLPVPVCVSYWAKSVSALLGVCSTVMDTLEASWTISMATLEPAVQAVTRTSVVYFNCMSMQACHCMWVSQRCMITSGARASTASLDAVVLPLLLLAKTSDVTMPEMVFQHCYLLCKASCQLP